MGEGLLLDGILLLKENQFKGVVPLLSSPCEF